MSLIDKILGRRLASSEAGQEELNAATGVPVLGLDALSSIAYGPEAALSMLMAIGLAGLNYLPAITFCVLAILAMLYISYLQTIAAYPNGGGAYIVAKENLGVSAGVLAAAALLLDYLLNVAVGISAGVAAIVSAFPPLHRYNLSLCMFVLLILTLVNLRGVRESGLLFGIPTLVFICCVTAAAIMGFLHSRHAGPPTHPSGAPTQVLTTWLFLRAFASGCTAMTGVEAVSNGVPLFREPKVRNARLTLTTIVLILGCLLIAVGYLCRDYHIIAMNQEQPGYQTILSQLLIAVAGRGAFYYVATAGILVILAFSANTSFADFPRVCRLLAEDGFLPSVFAIRGRRLVYSMGIGILAVFSGLLLAIFGGITEKLIPLFAVGAFSAFTLSQAGMVVRWYRRKGLCTPLVVNMAGALSTGGALVIIIIAKFIEGAWVTVIVIPAMILLFKKIEKHYRLIAQEIDHPVRLKVEHPRPPIVILPINGWNKVAEKALRFAFEFSEEILAVHVSRGEENPEKMRQLWAEKVEAPARAANFIIPKLIILESPYRQIYQPFVDFVNRTRKENPNRIVAIVIPELVEPHWYEYFLHNLYLSSLRALIFLHNDRRTMVIQIPWYLREDS